jgi:hypothetical protein
LKLKVNIFRLSHLAICNLPQSKLLFSTPLAYGLWLMAYGLWLMAYGLWLMAYGKIIF